MVKRLSAMQETWVQTLGWEDPLEKEMGTHSSTLTWKIPWIKSLVGYSPWGREELDMTEQLLFLSLFSCHRLIDHKCVGLFLRPLFCSADICVCFCVSMYLFR